VRTSLKTRRTILYLPPLSVSIDNLRAQSCVHPGAYYKWMSQYRESGRILRYR
jgi:hypothetical protein